MDVFLEEMGGRLFPWLSYCTSCWVKPSGYKTPLCLCAGVHVLVALSRLQPSLSASSTLVIALIL